MENNNLHTETEQRILAAAKKIFQKKGHNGARMQEIADEAGINKSLLHYYFRSKDKLFEAVFKEAFQKMLPMLTQMFESNIPLEDKIRLFFDKHIGFLLDNPYLPQFILHELSANPERLHKYLAGSVDDVKDHVINQFNEKMKHGDMHLVDPRHIILSLLSLSVFPFIIAPVFKMIFGFSDESFREFLKERKTYLPEFVIKAIKSEAKE